jgi:hypothetical protein
MVPARSLSRSRLLVRLCLPFVRGEYTIRPLFEALTPAPCRTSHDSCGGLTEVLWEDGDRSGRATAYFFCTVRSTAGVIAATFQLAMLFLFVLVASTAF